MCVFGIQSLHVYRMGSLKQTLWWERSSVCVDRWRGHSRCRAPLTTGVDIYPKVLPSAYCVLLAGPLPLQGALNHWGRYLPQGPTICILCASGTHTHWTLPTTMSVLETPLQGALNHWGRILPQGPTIQNNQLKKRVCVKILDFDL